MEGLGGGGVVGRWRVRREDMIEVEEKKRCGSE